MTAPRILISGASIAGPALAWWLNRCGWSTTVVERFEGRREGGHNIDVRGAAREVLRRMGLEDAVRDAGTGELGLAAVDERGRRLGVLPAGTGDTDGATAELEILRGDLAGLLIDDTRERTVYRYGDRIATLDEHDAGVRVGLTSGAEEDYDLVVVAEGLTSRTRATVLPEARITDLGLYVTYLTLPRTASDDDWWRTYTTTGGRAAYLRPDNHGTVRAGLALRTGVRGLDDLPREDQIRLLRRTFDDAGWETPRILDALDETPFVFDTVGQMRLPTWTRGRVALLGDAAYCASPMSGMSTSLALVGAYVLAASLHRHHDRSGPASHRAAFADYEAMMRPYVTQAQALPPGAPGIMFPRSATGVRLLRAGFRVVGHPLARRVGGLAAGWFAPPADLITLPDLIAR